MSDKLRVDELELASQLAKMHFLISIFNTCYSDTFIEIYCVPYTDTEKKTILASIISHRCGGSSGGAPLSAASAISSYFFNAAEPDFFS